MKSTKRITALVLAGLMVLGTMGYIFSMMANAASYFPSPSITNATYTVKSNDGGSTSTIKKNDNISLEIELEGDSFLNNDLTVRVVTGKFQENNNFSAQYDKSTKKITISGVKYIDNTGNLMEIGLKPATSTEKVMKLEITQCDVSGGSSSSGNSDPNSGGDGDKLPAGVINPRYSLEEVYTQSSSGNKTYYFNVNDGTNKDSSIKKGRLATIRAKVTDENGTVAGVNAAKASLDMGSFTGGSITIEGVTSYGDGVQYYIVFKGIKYSGNGNTLSAIVKSDSYYAELAATVSECVPYVYEDPKDDNDVDTGSLAVATPYVIISQYGYGGKEITAGETFTLSLTFYNTSANVDVQNMMVTVGMPEDLMLTNSSNTFYIDNLTTKSSVTKTIQVTARPNAKAQSHNLDVSMKYQYIDHHTNARRDNSTDEKIAIPVIQIDRFQVTGIEVQNEIGVGEEGLITVNFVNKGRSDVYNISAEITGNIQNPGQQKNLGNLTSGSTGTVDFYAIPTEAGTISGEVIITYEDTNMEEKTVNIPYSATVIDYSDMAGGGMGGGKDPMFPGGDMGGMEPEEEKKSPLPWVVGGVAVAAVAVGIIAKKQIDKKRSEAADADL
ncbi:MAG: hypothetical protein VB100_06025 [Angelakisella sp.]|nr:hypothetical protein [Angelakisella sp.]